MLAAVLPDAWPVRIALPVPNDTGTFQGPVDRPNRLPDPNFANGNPDARSNVVLPQLL